MGSVVRREEEHHARNFDGFAYPAERRRLVGVRPETTTFTRTPSGVSSAASTRAIDGIAALLAA